MNKNIPLIIGAVIGATTGMMVGSGTPTINLLGIAIIATFVIYFYREIKELFLETETDKVFFLLFIAVLGAGVIVINSISRSQWQMGISWGAWVIFCMLLLRKLSQLISDDKFALEMQKANTKHFESNRNYINYLVKYNKELRRRLEEIVKKSNTEPKKKKQLGENGAK